MSEDKDSMSSAGGEMDTGAANGIDERSSSKMSNKSPDKQPPVKSGKTVTCNVVLLDGESIDFQLDKNDPGRALFDKVCTHLDLIEKDYFGFTYTDDRGPSHLKYWLNLDKKISKQKKRGPWVFDFALKFYPPDPTHLRESLTRWLVVLQVRRDLLSGRLPCTFTTYALLGSYSVQADVGDFDRENEESCDYIKDMPFSPNQTPDLLEKISQLHKQHKGQTPDEAEKYFLDNAKKLSMYGVDMHKAKDSENKPIMLGVCASGLLIYRDKLRINRFVWPKILKLSYKRNHFYIKIRPGELERNEGNIMFKLDNHRLAKRLWKTCVEHHAFFRLREAEKPNNNPTFPRFGSKFRYSGRTLYQTRQTAALLDRPQPFFERSQPARNTFYEASDRSKSVDELANRRDYEGYDDGMYDPQGNKYLNKYDDERDRRDIKKMDPAYENLGSGGDRYGEGEDGTLQRRPYDANTEDRRDRLASPEDATLERDRRQGQGHDDDEAMGVVAGEVHGRPETAKERRKREKEEDKKRRKEAEEKKRKEEEERKRAEKEKKKKGKGGDIPTSEDRTDKMGQDQALETTFDGGPDGRGLEGGALMRGPGDGTGDKDSDRYGDGYDKHGRYAPDDKYGDKYGPPGYAAGEYDKDGKYRDGDGKDKDGKDKDKKVKKSNSFFGRKKKDKDRHDSDSDSDGAGKKGRKGAKGKGKGQDTPDRLRDAQGNLYGAPGYPYGVGLGVGKGDMTGVVGKESHVENKQFFLPLKEPVKETKDSLKGHTDNMMSFFHPDATSTVGRSKVPPPVPPKGSYGMDDSFNRNDYKTERDGVEEFRVEQKVVMSGDESEDVDFDAALAEAIRSVTEFNPDMSVERIECVQQIEDVKDGK